MIRKDCTEQDMSAESTKVAGREYGKITVWAGEAIERLVERIRRTHTKTYLQKRRRERGRLIYGRGYSTSTVLRS